MRRSRLPIKVVTIVPYVQPRGVTYLLVSVGSQTDKNAFSIGSQKALQQT